MTQEIETGEAIRSVMLSLSFNKAMTDLLLLIHFLTLTQYLMISLKFEIYQSVS